MDSAAFRTLGGVPDDDKPTSADDPTPSTDHPLIARDLEHRTWTEIRARVANDRLVGKLADMVENGVDAPAEQAAALGEPIAEVRNARRRLFALAETVARSFTEESP